MEASTSTAPPPGTLEKPFGHTLRAWANKYGLFVVLLILPVFYGIKDLTGLEKCPNLRPAFSALREMGFTKLRVLLLPTSFEKDWVEKGYPVER